MLNRLRELIEEIAEGNKQSEVGQQFISNEELQIAAAVIFVEIAGADQSFSQAESDKLCSLLVNKLGISADQVPHIVRNAIAARKQSGKIDEFIGLLNKDLSREHRIELLAMVWKIVLADGKVEKAEENLARQLGTRFQLSEADLEEARQLAQ